MKKLCFFNTLVFSLLLSFAGQAQFGSNARYNKRVNSGKSVRGYHSMQGMFSMIAPMKSTLELTMRDAKYADQPNSTKTFTHENKGQWGITGGLSGYYNVIQFNELTAISLIYGFEGAVNAMLMTGVETPAVTTDLIFSQLRIGLPLGFAFKHGGEVSYDKRDNFSFTLGAGLMPAMEPSALIGGRQYYQKFRFTSNPFFFTEIGMFAFIQWKVRLSVYPKGFEGINVMSDPSNELGALAEHVRFSTTGTGNMFQISLAFMPFSFGWDDTRF